jgi:hypothetical protein
MILLEAKEKEDQEEDFMDENFIEAEAESQIDPAKETQNQKEEETNLPKIFSLEEYEQNLNADELLEYDAVNVRSNVSVLLNNGQIISEKGLTPETDKFLPALKPRIRDPPILRKRYTIFLAGIYYSFGLNADPFLI